MKSDMPTRQPTDAIEVVQRKSNSFEIILIIGIASAAIRLLMNFEIYSSALLYVTIPFIISLALIKYTQRDTEYKSWTSSYWNYFRSGLIIMLASSVILLEGFICVMMFMPIYFGVLTVTFVIDYLVRRYKKWRLSAHILPILVVIMSLEGTHEKLSFDRNHQITVTHTTAQSVDEIKNNLIKPIQLNDKTRPWFLKIFPQPYDVQAESLIAGDVHEVHYRYHRWFVTNTHEGKIRLKIAEVSDDSVKTQILEDTSYMSNYMTLHGTDIAFKPLANGNTQVSLTVNFTRKLDPSWYFKPLEKFGVEKTAEYLMEHVILRKVQSS